MMNRIPNMLCSSVQQHGFWMLVLAGLFFSRPLYADTIIEAGIHFGGEELIQTTYTNGTTGSIRAGEAFSFAFGPLFHLSESWKLQTTFGIKSDADYPDDESLTKWIRYPLNAILFYSGESYRIGLGATYHFSPSLSGTGVAGNINQDYESAAGQIFEIDFRRSDRFLWGIRFTRIEYQGKTMGPPIEGNSVGLLVIAQM